MQRPSFTLRRTGARYDRAQVDALVERLLATVERRTPEPVTAKDLRSVQFGTPFFSQGYPAEEVDEFLAEAERWLPAQPKPAHTGPVTQRPAPQFTTVRLREGYATDEVDPFVERLMATVNGQPVERPVTVREIARVQFRPVRLSEGYDVEEVDLFLERAEEWLTE